MRTHHVIDQRKGILRQCCTIWLQSWHFFARGTTLADRQSDVNNIAIRLSLSPLLRPSFSLFSARSSPLLSPRDTVFPSPSDCQRSPVIPFIFRCSLLTREFPWLRYPPGGWNQSCFCSLHLSLASSLFFSPSFPLLLQLFSSPPFLLAIISVPPTWSRRLVRRSAAIMTSRGGEYAPHQDRLHSRLHAALIDRPSRWPDIYVLHFGKKRKRKLRRDA